MPTITPSRAFSRGSARMRRRMRFSSCSKNGSNDVLTAFRSLRIRNYRLWAAGALVSNIGTWMQRTAQDWLVLTHLTHHNATAVGIVMSLQFGPQLVLLPFTGLAADRLNRRKLLMATQAAMGA